MEFLLGGVAACGAGFFTNPLEVAKTRQQLQGELRARGQYTVHYRNVLHAFYTVGKVEGLAALQKGLVPALWYQFFMNGCRLGAYQWFTNQGLVQDKNGCTSFPRCVLAGAVSGCIGASVGSPFYMVILNTLHIYLTCKVNQIYDCGCGCGFRLVVKKFNWYSGGKPHTTPMYIDAYT